MNEKEKDNFMITPCDKIVNIDSKNEFKKLRLTETQKIQMGGLMQQLPMMLAANSLSGAYTVQFPAGISGQLMQYKSGGFGTPIQGEDGKIIGHASIEPLKAQAAVLGAFSVMAVASGQYFLAQINSELKTISQSIDKILEFLYGDKKAELMSEISFVKYAYENYESIINHEFQRGATIASLQEARKVAMKDIEFYMNDLNLTVKGKGTIEAVTGKALQIKESLDLSIQLYGMSVILEVYYAQNYDAEYLNYVENEVSVYIDKCEKRILSSFSILSRFIDDRKRKILEKTDKSVYEKSVEEILDSLNTGKESDIRRTLREALRLPISHTEYYLTSDGDIYLKAS